MVYLLHFDRPYRHAQHYVGYTNNLEQRLDVHRNPRLSHHHRLMQVIHDAGIGFTLARTWNGDRALERRIKRHGGARRLCPHCNPNALQRARFP